MFISSLENGAHGNAVVYAFPHAGGTAAMLAPFAKAGQPDFTVRCIDLPGRLTRLNESPRIEFGLLVAEVAQYLAAEVERLGARPYAILGSCGGAYLALEVARTLRTRMARPPVGLMVVSAAAPDVAPIPYSVGYLPAESLWRYLVDHQGVPERLDEDPSFRRLTERSIRADFKLFADYRYVPQPPLDLDIRVLHGAEDTGLRRGELLGWRRQSTRTIRVSTIANCGRWLLEHQPVAVAEAAGDLFRAARQVPGT
jgi:surfactin synthase thioesterase subunit